MKVTPENITHLKPNEVFTFGSNQAGIHGAGAARLAFEKFGAVYGEGEGLRGQSYALPTKDHNIETLQLEDIQFHVEVLQIVIKNNPDKEFLITKVGCGLAGYTSEQIAPLFKDFITIPNCSLPQEFIDIINHTNG